LTARLFDCLKPREQFYSYPAAVTIFYFWIPFILVLDAGIALSADKKL
jgi:hypothetical protein